MIGRHSGFGGGDRVTTTPGPTGPTGPAGAVRTLGPLFVYATGIGGTSPCRIALNWREVR